MKKNIPFLVRLAYCSVFLFCCSSTVFSQTLESILPQQAFSPNMLKQLAFDPDKSGKGYAVGLCGAFWQTEDHGESWQEQTDVPQADFEQLAIFPGSGGQRLLIFSMSEVFLSTNGGTDNWEVVFETSLSDGSVTDAYTTSAQEAILATSSGRIYRSSDGGQSWQIDDFQTAGLSAQTLDFTSLQNGWLGTLDGSVFRTANGGGDWERVSSVEGAIYSLDFLNDTVGFAATSRGIYSLQGNPLQWTQISNLPPNSGVEVQTISSTLFVQFSNVSIILYFTEGDNLQFRGSWPPLIAQFGLTSSRLLLSGSEGWSCGQEANIAKVDLSTLKGTYKNGTPPPYNFRKISFLDQDRIAGLTVDNNLSLAVQFDKEDAIEPELIYRGINFFTIIVPLSNNRVLLANSDRVNIYENRRSIIKLKQWSGQSIVDIQKEKETGFLYLLANVPGLSAELYKSTDEGENWVFVNSFSFPADRVHIPEKDVLFVFNSSSRALGLPANLDYSEDGGLNWRIRLSDEDFSITSAGFRDRNFGVLTIDTSLLLTEDGGFTYDVVLESNLSNFIFQDDKTIWALDKQLEYTLLKRSRDKGQSWQTFSQICNRINNMILDEETGDLWFASTSGRLYVLRNEQTYFYPAVEEGDFQVYPNPSTGCIWISFPRQQPNPAHTLEVYNLAGQLIEQHQLQDQASHIFDWSRLASGMYILHLSGEDFRATRKVFLHPQSKN
ncbi:MAG: YCF48-related protein [Bacteroidota bacterium]